MSKFHKHFWSESNLDGISVLYSQHLQSNLKIQDLISLLESKVYAQETYSTKLDVVASMQLKSQDSSLEAYQAEIYKLNQVVKIKSKNLKNLILELKSCLKDVSGFKQEIDALAKTLDKQMGEIVASGTNASIKYQKADEAKELEPLEAIDSLDLIITIGSVNMTVEEFNNTCFFLQKQGKMEDIKGFLTTTRDCCSLETFLGLISTHLEISGEESNLFLNELINRGFLSKISNTHVKWKKMYMENEKPSKIAKRDADVADLEYRKLVQLGQNTRRLLEEKSLEFMVEVEQEIKERVLIMKKAFKMIIDSDSSDASVNDESRQNLGVFLEMMDPEKEVLMIIEQYRTGSTRSKPIIYRNHYSGPEIVFGVCLEQTVRKFNRKIPIIITKTLEVISEYFSSEIGVESQLDSWINYDIDHQDVNLLINLCNSGSVQRHVLKTYPVAAVIGLLARYLLDLPNSVCSNEIYDALKILYLSKSDDQSAMRLNSLRSVLSSMPSSHFHVLLYLIKYWVGLVKSSKPDEQKLNELSVILGPLILRPEQETKLTLHDKHPSRLVKDLIVHFEDIFSLEVLSTQTSMDELEASLRESLDGSSVIESQDYYDDPASRKFSLESLSANAIQTIDKELIQEITEQEPTPIEESTFGIGQD